MGKLFGIILLVAGVWIGLEIFTKGMDGAFGGVFASGETTSAEAAVDTVEPLPVYKRVGIQVGEDIERGFDRTDQALSE